MPDPWRVKYDGTCARCGITLRKGTPAAWDRASRTIHCIECPPAADVSVPPADAPAVSPEAPTPAPAPITIDPGIAGRSARVEHDRREAKRQQAITDRWGTGFVAKVVRALSDEPQSTRAWAIGAAGEEKLAAELAKVPSIRMLHDRRVPGTRGNIDHIVVAPAGVFVIDAKNHEGSLAIVDRGGFFHTDYRLTIGRRDCSALADGMTWQVDAVRAALPDGAPPVIAVLCFLRVEWPLFRAPDGFRGVLLEGPRSVRRLMTRASLLDEAQIDALAAHLAARFPPK